MVDMARKRKPRDKLLAAQLYVERESRKWYVHITWETLPQTDAGPFASFDDAASYRDRFRECWT